MPVVRSYDPPSTVPTEEIAPRIDRAHANGPERGTARIPDTYSTTGSDLACGGWGSHSPTPTRTEHAVADQPSVRSDLGQHYSQSNYPVVECDDMPDHEQSGHRLLEERDHGGPSQHPGTARSSRQTSVTFWRPFCLRRTTSLLFMVAFTVKAATLEMIFAVSQRNSGLHPGMPSLRYLWSYGTTGILTVTAALWHRLDYETRVSAPWLRAYPITTSKDALLVDYIDSWSLLVPFRALRNQDYEVVYSSTISLLLQVLIILSTSLFTLVPTELVNNAEPVFLTSRFIDDPARLNDSESLLPYYITMGNEISIGNLSKMMGAHSTYPDGCTGQFAHQTFDPVSSSLEQVETTVQGLALGLVCETASVGKTVTIPWVFYQGHTYSLGQDSAYFEVNHQGCQITIDWDTFGDNKFYFTDEVDHWVPNNKTVRKHVMMLRGVPGLARNQCDSTDQAAHRLVFLSLDVEWRPHNQSIISEMYDEVKGIIDANVLQAIALVCTPSLEQPLLDVSRSSGGVQNVTRRGGNPTDLLSAIHPWDFIRFLFKWEIIVESMHNVMVGNATVWADVHSQVVLAFCGQLCQGVPGLLNDTALLQDILAKFVANYAATTAHTILRERANIASTGTSSSIVVRLWVEPIACQAMVALLVLLILIIVGFQSKQQKKLTRRINPGSIAATTILAGQAAISNFPNHLGSANTKEFRKALAGFLDTHGSSSSHPLQHTLPRGDDNLSCTSTRVWKAASCSPVFQNPLPLRPVSKNALILITVGCGTTLMVLLRKSTHEQGLGDTADSKYLLFAWTTAPAVILTMISWWLSSIDTQVRLLAPYHSLKRKNCSRSVLGMDLLRGLIPLVLYQELKTSDFAATSTTLAALLGASLTTVSAPMFHAVTYPVSSPIELSQNTVFISPAPYTDRDTDGRFGYLTQEVSASWIETVHLSSLILETNFSYPWGSYQDLVLPTFSIAAFEIENISHTPNASSATVKVTAPALRPRLSCRVYSPSDIAAVYVRNQSVFFDGANPTNGILVNITQELCSFGPTYGGSTAVFTTDNLYKTRFAAANSNRAGTIRFDPQICSSMLYVWGYHDASPGLVTNVSAVACNSSVELVDATFSLLWPDLSLNLAVAPEAIESTVRNIRDHGAVDSFISGDFYNGLASSAVANDNLFDSFFQQLVTSRYAIPISAIGDPTQADIVLNAIRFQHGIIEAQILSNNYRVDINSPRVMENATTVLTPTVSNNSTSNGSASYSATLTYPFGRQRVVQDPTATAIVEALLLSILILLIIGRFFGSSEPPLPRSPSSVGSVLALLAGGNILEHLYDGSPEPLCWNDIMTRLGEESNLYLGWDPSSTNDESEQRRFGIWIIK